MRKPAATGFVKLHFVGSPPPPPQPHQVPIYVILYYFILYYIISWEYTLYQMRKPAATGFVKKHFVGSPPPPPQPHQVTTHTHVTSSSSDLLGSKHMDFKQNASKTFFI